MRDGGGTEFVENDWLVLVRPEVAAEFVPAAEVTELEVYAPPDQLWIGVVTAADHDAWAQSACVLDTLQSVRGFGVHPIGRGS